MISLVLADDDGALEGAFEVLGINEDEEEEEGADDGIDEDEGSNDSIDEGSDEGSHDAS
jgi:hypothetical protein